MSMDKIGVVILNYITWQQTLNCIESIQKSAGIGKPQIYVVDNASPNCSEFKDTCWGENVHFISNSRNMGYAAGNNVGIAQALKDKCDYILISNNDVVFERNSIFVMGQYLASHREYGIVAPCILDKDKMIQRCHFMKCMGYRDIWATQTILRYISKKITESVYGNFECYEVEQDIFAASGCCFMMSAECAGKVFPLDEHTFLYEEENILGIRMKKQRLKTRYLPLSKVIHYHDQTTRLVKPFALICWACSEIYYLSEYLHVSKRKIRLLYNYRKMIFLLHGLKNPEYRKQWRDYKEKTGSFLKKYNC